jgi:hypothetical protein
MLQFKTASRSAEEMKTASQTLDEVFSKVKGANGSVNKKAVRELEENRFEIAELIIQLLNDTMLLTDPTPYLADVVSGDISNQYVWQEPNSTLRVVSRSYGTKPVSQRLTFKEYSISTVGKEIAVEVPLEEVATGRITPSMITEAMATAMNRDKIKTLLDAIDAGIPSGNDHTGKAGYTLRYSGLTADNLDHALDGLMDDSESPVIIGRHIALAPAIRSFTGWSNETLRELEIRGMIGTYHNAPIVTMKDTVGSRYGDHVISATKAYVACGTKGAKLMNKDVSFLNWATVDPRTSTFGVGTRLEYGVLVFDPYKYRVIESIS